MPSLLKLKMLTVILSDDKVEISIRDLKMQRLNFLNKRRKK